MNRFSDPPLVEDMALSEVDPEAIYQGAADQARLIVTFLKTLEAYGLPHDEALWLTAQFWRSQ